MKFYLYRWNRQGRKGQICRVLCRGSMNSCLLEFADGFKMVTSRNALKRAPHALSLGHEGCDLRQGIDHG
jgi:hypothetical protein